MWAKLSYRQKLRYLGIGAILLLVICYRFSISKTIAEYSAYAAYEGSAALMPGVQADRVLEEKEGKLNKLLDQFVLDTLDNSKNLLSIVSSYCDDHELVLKEYRPQNLSPTDTLRVLTRTVTVEGRYINCLQLVHALETKYKAGKVRSVLFKSNTNANHSQTVLYCTLYIQNLIMKQYEN